MDVMAGKGEIDLSIYGLLKANKEELYTIAIRT
jgi:hypothetical protein